VRTTSAMITTRFITGVRAATSDDIRTTRCSKIKASTMRMTVGTLRSFHKIAYEASSTSGSAPLAERQYLSRGGNVVCRRTMPAAALKCTWHIEPGRGPCQLPHQLVATALPAAATCLLSNANEMGNMYMVKKNDFHDVRKEALQAKWADARGRILWK
jgi:hypothetical protein